METNRNLRATIIGFAVAIPIGLLIGSYAIKAAAFYGNLVGNLPAFIASCLLVSWLHWVIKQQKTRWEILIGAMTAGLVSIMLATMLGFQSLVQDPATTLTAMGALLMIALLSKFILNLAQGK